MITVKFQNAEALGLIRKLPTKLGRKVWAAAGGALESLVRRHFLERGREPNKQGWPSRNFWAKEGAQKTALIGVTESGATIGISSPAIAHKIQGGTIRPKRGKMLAIPASARAYAAGSPRAGKWASGELFLVRPSGKNPFLASAAGDAITPQYWLVPSVTQAPDPRTLPTPEAMAEAVEQAAADAVTRILEETK